LFSYKKIVLNHKEIVPHSNQVLNFFSEFSGKLLHTIVSIAELSSLFFNKFFGILREVHGAATTHKSVVSVLHKELGIKFFSRILVETVR
jgi:hypothetical protein